METYLAENLLSGTSDLAPGLPCPGFTNHMGYLAHARQHLQTESAHTFGLHPNAEIGVLTAMTDDLFAALLELEPADLQGGFSSAASSTDAQVRAVCHAYKLVRQHLNRFATGPCSA